MISRIGDINATAEITIVFVHGLGGSKETWKKFTEMLNEKWTKSTPIDLFYIVYTPEDKKGLLGKTLFNNSNIDRLSYFLKNYIEESCKDHKYILLVGHSMGGLISRKYSIDNMDSENFNITDLVTYATPNKGSLIANILVGFILFMFVIPFIYFIFNFSLINFFIAVVIDIFLLLFIYWISNPQFRQLALGSRFIKNLNIEWSKKEVYNKIKFITVAAGRDWIVKLKSSHHYEDDITQHIDEGKSHFTILTPVDINDYSLTKLYNVIQDRINEILSDDIVDEDGDGDETQDEKPMF